MRLGRSLAAAVGTAALVVAGALAGPAAADDPGFRSGNSDVTTSPSQPVTISGVGCTPAKEGKPSSIAWHLYTMKGVPIEGARGAENASADGTWNFTIDVPAIMKTAGLKDPTLVGLAISCVDYNGNKMGDIAGTLTIDSTELKGTAKIISTDTDGDGKYDTQTFDVDLTGFTPGETVTIFVNDEDFKHTDLSSVTADANGRITYQGPVPTNLPDGKYLFRATGSTYGESFASKPIQVKDGWWQVDGENIPVDPDKPAPTAAPSAPADPNGTATAGPNGTGTATADPAGAPKSGLAKTGASLGLAVVAAGLLAAGGIVLIHRRRV